MSPTSFLLLTIFLILTSSSTRAMPPITVKNITTLGAQLTPDVTDISRDGGYSALLNGNIVWLYDDTECMDVNGDQLSFVSNTAAYAEQGDLDFRAVNDFGVVNLGRDLDGLPKTAILADTTVGTGGWIPFQPDELDFNKQMAGKERVAIWPGTAPTSISTTQAFLFAPLVYVDMHPADPSKEYQGRGLTLITLTAPPSGPVAARQGDVIIFGTQVGFGGFTTLVGHKSTDTASDKDAGSRDLYLLGVTPCGLQLARVGLDDLTNFSKFTFWSPLNQTFTSTPPSPKLTNPHQIYIPGTFSSGSIFFSPYFKTYLLIYFNKQVDSTFYIRALNLSAPLTPTQPPWTANGKNGQGIQAEDAEALVRYAWSAEQILYASPVGSGGFNYAGTPHPEFFNRQYFAPSLYPDSTPQSQRLNPWYGGGLIPEAGTPDGKNLLLSWTSQESGAEGTYAVQLAVVEFGDLVGGTGGSSAVGEARPGKSAETVGKVLATAEKGEGGVGRVAFWGLPLLGVAILVGGYGGGWWF